MPGYTIPQVRDIAKKHQYKEISLNEKSRLISFGKNDVRINVYYTTGTVGTCLNHPTKGKTQLFRRNVTLPELDSLFAKPRKHTGKGYYRKHVGQKWKNNADGTLISDAARRWEYVAETTGLVLASEHPLDLQQWMEDVSNLLFDNSHTTPRRLYVTPEARRFVLYLVSKQAALDGAVGMVPNEEYTSLPCSEWTLQEYSDYDFSFDGLPNRYEHQFDSWSEKLQSFPKPLRMEISNWCMGLLGHVLIMEHLHQYYQTYTSAIGAAHVEYSKSYYTKRQLRYLDVTFGIVVE